MKIAFIIPSLSNLGPIIVVKNLIEYLIIDKDISIDVYYFDECKKPLDFSVPVFKIDFLKFNSFDKYDIVHSHGIRPDFYSFFNNSCPNTISTQHNIIFEEYNVSSGFLKAKLVELLWKISLLNKKRVVAIGDTAQKYYKKLLKSSHVINIPNGRTFSSNGNISKEDLEKIYTLKSQYKCIGTCTRVLKLKGHKQIIQALVDLKEFCFILVGDGEYLNELKDLAKHLKVDHRCLFLGYRENATSYLPLFDIFSQTSYTESISIALLEAAASKKAIVCSDIPVNRDIFTDNEVAFFTLDDVSSLTNAIKKLSLDNSRYEKNVFEKYQQEYTSEKMAQRYKELYKELVNEL
ncbi:glycosyltransferase [Acinetobacter nosocomialis]|uniref:glycosyltransferase n=1 Tax=Acinetobacter nosocomialis TaxID=106654 RepID=UPI0009B963F0|nr:glycosyltransferase [Acinetobacter nosocomialis]MDO7216233.1 glycosyltransferase [Acinetobacter nosocomialis]MDO7438024.1 glycosyltransferase [Acinetobacter nosocomialis]